MNNRIFKMVLRPTRYFFFGNERTLGPDNSDYYVVSNPFPQQTTLLGVLRYKILEWQGGLADAAGNWPRSIEDIKNWIGPSSFRGVDAPGRLADYGYIQAISPALLYDGTACWIVAPKAVGSSKAADSSKVFDFSQMDGEACFGSSVVKKIPRLDGFNPKEYPGPPVFNLDTGEPRDLIVDFPVNRAGLNCKEDSVKGVFIPVTRVGITKPTRENPDQEKSFYKQTSWRFPTADWGFVFWVAFGEEMNADDFVKFVKDYPFTPVGGERSIFRISLEESELPSFNRLSDLMPDQGHQIVLLSDAWVSNHIYEEVDFAVSEVVDFRFISTRVDRTRWFSSMDPDGGAGGAMPTKSSRYHLLEKGTTLYGGTLPEELEIPIAFRQIGYNAYARFENGHLTKIKFLHSDFSS